jgi:hypothetical protein
MFEFEYEFMVCYLLETFSLDEIAQRNCVELSISLDGAELCHLMPSVKEADGCAIDV